MYLTLCYAFLKFDTSVTMGSPKEIGAYKILPGHSSSVQSVAVDPSRNMVSVT
jgi:ribosome biogenesis protein YTM1